MALDAIPTPGRIKTALVVIIPAACLRNGGVLGAGINSRTQDISLLMEAED